MNLYKISQTESRDRQHDLYGDYDSAVVAAENAKEAKSIHPDSGSFYGDAEWMRTLKWVENKKNIKCRLIGKASTGTKRGVICASYNAM